MRTLVAVLLCAAFFSMAHALPIEDDVKAKLYLQNYGYFEDTRYDSGDLITPDDISKTIKDFQRFGGLEPTGILDNNTISLMNTPRCGMKDKGDANSAKRRKRYSLQGSNWRNTPLTYRITKYPEILRKRNEVDKEFEKAVKTWSDVVPLTFEQRQDGPVDIEISFEVREHGDGKAFDGAGKTLAHAYFPQYGGDIHFDDEEKWTINEWTGTDLMQVATHELGHSLGLRHSSMPKAIMAPFYHGYIPKVKLDTDDIQAIESVYGRREVETPHDEEKPPDTSDAPDLCQDASIDAITQNQYGNTYAFKGNYYWKVLPYKIADGYPRKISEDWGSLEGNLDAALSWSNGKTYFFKGDRFWRFTGREMDSGYPKPMNQGFEGIPGRIDSAFKWSGNGKTYFFKGDKYWMYDPNNQLGREEYPRPISNWNGLPNNIDAAIQWENNRTYFFKGDKYYRYDDGTNAVEVFKEFLPYDPPYPRSTAVWWFGCPAVSSA